jgi:ribosomal protein L37AE/L43A
MKKAEEMIRDLGFNLERGFEDQKTKCPECQPPHDPRDNPVSISFQDGMFLWNCHHCGYKGGFPFTEKIEMKSIKKDVQPIFGDKQNFTSEMYKFFAERGISKETVDFFKIYQTQNG